MKHKFIILALGLGFLASSCNDLDLVPLSEASTENWNRLKEYIRSCYHRDDIMLAELDGQFIRDFDFWLKTEKHCQNNSALKHLKNLKKVVRIALANDWIKKDPFYGIHFKQEEVNVEFLSREELDILMNKEFAIKRLE